MHRFPRFGLCAVFFAVFFVLAGLPFVACDSGGDTGGAGGGASSGDPGADGSVGPDGAPIEPPKACTKPTECASKICSAAGFCARPSPTDGVKNGDETDVDCGGSAAPRCDVLKACLLAGDCGSGVCKDTGVGLQCQPPSPTDGVKNGDETDVDCGGLKAPKCGDGKSCTVRVDCINDVCSGGKCQAAICNDAIKNGTETDVDCGGSGCPRCDDLLLCLTADDCKSGVCKDAGGGVLKCAVPTPTDKVKNGTETDVDCGGGAAPKCAVDKTCAAHIDCVSDGCAYTGKCALGRSCTAKYGGDTCGSGGAGALGPAAWESCCANAPAGAGVSMNKYKVTAGRMRAFLERTKGNVRQFIADARAANALHGANMNPAWDAYLPTAMDGCEQDGSCGPNELTDHMYNDATPQLGIYSSAYRHLGGMMFDGQILPTQGCRIDSPGTHAYWMDAATQTKYFGDLPADYAQSDYDPKPMNCVNYLMAQSFCIWDGGRLETQAEYLAAGGAVNSNGVVDAAVPWGAPKPWGPGSSTYTASRFPTATDATQPNIPAGHSIEWATYLYSYEYPNLANSDYIVFLSAPGRMRARSPNGHADLVGPNMEITNDVNAVSASPKTTSTYWTANGSFEGHQWGYYGWNFSLLNKYGKQGLRCVYP
jgi:hypothetical protein